MSAEIQTINPYYNEHRMEAALKKNPVIHRAVIGGLWEELGQLQLDFVKKNGLSHTMTLIDVGCGCLRGGVPLIAYLDADHYYGLDLSPSLLNAGYDIELATAGLQHKLSRTHLQHSGDFEFDAFDAQFDMALAISLFTHLPLSFLTTCLQKLAPNMQSGSKFFATFFQCPDDDDPEVPLLHDIGGVTTNAATDPYHFQKCAIEKATDDTGWVLGNLASWDHPRNQQMATFHRL